MRTARIIFLFVLCAAVAIGATAVLLSRPGGVSGSGPEISLGAAGAVSCDSPSKPTKCSATYSPGNEKAFEFQITVNANTIPTGGYMGFQSEVLPGGLTYNSDTCADEVVLDSLGATFKSGSPFTVALCSKSIGGSGEIRHGVTLDSSAPFEVTNYVGRLIELDVHCPAAGTFKLTLTSYSTSPFGATYLDGTGTAIIVKKVTQDGVPVADTLLINCAIPAPPTSTPTQANTPTFTPAGPTSTPTKQPHPADTDGDGCSDEQENGLNPAAGGLRHYKNFWDFFDVWIQGPPDTWTRNKVVNIDEIFAIAGRFATVGDPGGNPLSPPTNKTGYHTGYDRTYTGPYAWNLGPPDGVIAIDEIFWAAAQFAHVCG